MITKLRLKNWKSHINSELEFSSGVNALIGIMGSGKSSIVQAISFALFGTFPGLQTRKLALDDIIMKKPNKKDSAEIELEFIAGNNVFNVLRELKRGKGTSKAEIRKNGELVDTGSSNVTKIIEETLQMDYELFSKAVYSEQNNMDFFLRIPRGNRKEQIDKMLKLDRFENVREQAVSGSNKIRSKIEEKIRLLAEMESEGIDEKINNIKAELSEILEDKDVARDERDKAKHEKEVIQDKLKEFESLDEELDHLKMKKESAKSRISELQETLKTITDRIGYKNIEKIKSEVSRHKEIKKWSSDLKKKKERIDHDIIELRNKIASINTEIKIISDSIADVNSLGGKCPICDTKITEEKKEEIVSGRKKREEELRSSLQKIVSELNKKKKEIEPLQREIDKNDRKIESLLEFEEIIKKEMNYRRDISKYDEEIVSLEKKLDPDYILSLKKEVEKHLKEEGSATARMNMLTYRMREKEERLEELMKRKSMLDKIKNEIAEDERVIKVLDKFANVLIITQNQLRDEFLKTMNDIMSSVWSELYPYGDFNDIRLWVDNDYILQLRENTGSWVSVEGIVSGGERSMAALALRIAFSLAFIPNLGWIMLDEPTHNLDSNAISQFAEVLRDKMHQFAEQVFLITHEEGLTDGITGNLYRLERDKELDGVTKIIDSNNNPL